MDALANNWADNKTLYLRIITAMVLMPIMVALALRASTDVLSYGLLIFIGLAAWEWSRLASLKYLSSQVFYAVLIPVCCLSVMHWVPFTERMQILHAALLWWAVALLSVCCFQLKRLSLPNHPVWLSVIGLFVLLPAWLSIVMLHKLQHGPLLVLALFAIIWGADSLAYFAGRRWGHKRLADRVSPGKSWEGFWAAVIAVLVFAFIYALFQQWSLHNIFILLLVCFLTVSSSVLGDLFESLMKRNSHQKDSGGLLPGHGGVMDRIDSITAAGPVFFCCIAWWTGVS